MLSICTCCIFMFRVQSLLILILIFSRQLLISEFWTGTKSPFIKSSLLLQVAGVAAIKQTIDGLLYLIRCIWDYYWDFLKHLFSWLSWNGRNGFNGCFNARKVIMMMAATIMISHSFIHEFIHVLNHLFIFINCGGEQWDALDLNNYYMSKAHHKLLLKLCKFKNT